MQSGRVQGSKAQGAKHIYISRLHVVRATDLEVPNMQACTCHGNGPEFMKYNCM